jgi:hypothetical protein
MEQDMVNKSMGQSDDDLRYIGWFFYLSLNFYK